MEQVFYENDEIEPTIPPKRNRLEYREIERFTDETNFDQWINTTFWTKERTSIQVTTYICKFAMRKGYKCGARLRVIRPQRVADLIRVEEASTAHDHEPKVPLKGPMKLTVEAKQIIIEKLEDGRTAQDIHLYFQELYRTHLGDVPELLQIQNCIKRHRKSTSAKIVTSNMADILTKRGKQKLEHSGFLYVFDKYNKDADLKFWKCQYSNSTDHKCKGRLHTDLENHALKEIGVHYCPTTAVNIAKQRLTTAIKRRALGTMESPSVLRAATLENVPTPVLAQIPSKEAIKQMVKRVRRDIPYAAPQYLEEIVVSDNYSNSPVKMQDPSKKTIKQMVKRERRDIPYAAPQYLEEIVISDNYDNYQHGGNQVGQHLIAGSSRGHSSTVGFQSWAHNYGHSNEQARSNVQWEKLGIPPNELYAKGMDINEKVLKQIGQLNNKEYLGQGIISSQPFPVEGIIYGDQNLLMICLACQRAYKPSSPFVNVWFLVNTGSKHTYICERAMDLILGEGFVFEENVPIVIQNPNNVIECKLSDLVELPEINILGMNALLDLEVNIENMNRKTRTFRLSN